MRNVRDIQQPFVVGSFRRDGSLFARALHRGLGSVLSTTASYGHAVVAHRSSSATAARGFSDIHRSRNKFTPQLFGVASCGVAETNTHSSSITEHRDFFVCEGRLSEQSSWLATVVCPNMAVKTDCGIGGVSPASPPRATAAYLQR
jgi:hypothetical protein